MLDRNIGFDAFSFIHKRSGSSHALSAPPSLSRKRVGSTSVQRQRIRLELKKDEITLSLKENTLISETGVFFY